MAGYVLTNKAVEDLSAIWNYTFATWSEGQADKYYQLIIDAFETIVQNPKIGKLYDEIDAGISGVRVGKHIVFYQQDNLNQLTIIRILHQRMDLKSKIKE